jgi:hypothetical protein
MKYLIHLLITCCLFEYGVDLKGQSTIPANGGSATGTGGSATYTVGQVAFSVITGTNGFIIQGVQQPYEISTVTAIDNTEDITLRFAVYPNPTEGIIRLVIGSFNNGSYMYQLYDLSGKVIRENVITDRVTELSLESLPSAVYLLRVLMNSREVKVFKIVKN